MDRTYMRGDMYFADLGQGIGSEQEGIRPVIIVQNNIGNRYSPTVIVAPITGQTDKKRRLPTHCFIGAENGLERPSVALLEQIRTVDKRRLDRYIGRLDAKYMDSLDHALAASLDLIHRVPDTLVMSLCGVCAENFRNTGAYLLRRIDPEQTEKETCTYCSQRSGYDFEVMRKR